MLGCRKFENVNKPRCQAHLLLLTSQKVLRKSSSLHLFLPSAYMEAAPLSLMDRGEWCGLINKYLWSALKMKPATSYNNLIQVIPGECSRWLVLHPSALLLRLVWTVIFRSFSAADGEPPGDTHDIFFELRFYFFKRKSLFNLYKTAWNLPVSLWFALLCFFFFLFAVRLKGT